jgi:hypothetical protein
MGSHLDITLAEQSHLFGDVMRQLQRAASSLAKDWGCRVIVSSF